MSRLSIVFKFALPFAAVLLIGFVVGQAAPQTIPVSWSIGHSRLDFYDLNSTYDLLKSKFDGNVDPNKVIDGARAGVIASAGDPYTVYLDASAAKSLNDQLSGTLSGVGAEVGIKNNKLAVIAPVAGSPAAKAGLLAGDVIAEIDHKSSSQYTLDEAVGHIRGKKGTKVTLTIIRGTTQAREITITREVITVPSVNWSMKPGNIGYINITTFGNDTSQKIVEAANDLKKQGAQKIILDLRNDPGGYLDSAVVVVSQFVPEGKLVVEERHHGATQQKLETSGNGALVGLPIVVLINSGSASASEIAAAALRDDIGAKLIGEKSFGKGSVQEVIKLDGGAELKVTVAHWFTPNGQGIDKKGITPTIEVKQTPEDFNTGRDPQLDRALKELGQ